VSRREHAGISDQRKASVHRLEDARALFEKKRWRGSMYLAGYAVECRLKSKLMEKWRCYTLMELEARLLARKIDGSPFTHSLKVLLRLSGATDRMKRNGALWLKFTNTVNRWRPAWRYSSDLGTRSAAEECLEFTSEVVAWIENNV
jgi:HEPN domain-containing protein